MRDSAQIAGNGSNQQVRCAAVVTITGHNPGRPPFVARSVRESERHQDPRRLYELASYTASSSDAQSLANDFDDSRAQSELSDGCSALSSSRARFRRLS